MEDMIEGIDIDWINGADDLTDYPRNVGDDDEEGCCFPGECCMPGYHLRGECHTAEMAQQYFDEQYSSAI